MRKKLIVLRKWIADIHKVRKYSTNRDPNLRCHPHMNELPVPCKPWGPWYNKQQQVYNLHLFIGLSWFLFSLNMAVQSGALLTEYWGPPERAGPPTDMVDECED